MTPHGTPRRERRLSPARLLLGLALLAIAPAHLLVALREDGPVDRAVLLGLLPAALLLAGCLAALPRLVRQVWARARRR